MIGDVDYTTLEAGVARARLPGRSIYNQQMPGAKAEMDLGVAGL